MQPSQSPVRAPARGRVPLRYRVWAAESHGGRRAAAVIQFPAAQAAHRGMASATLQDPATMLRPVVTRQAADRRQHLAGCSLGCPLCSAVAKRNLDEFPTLPTTLSPGPAPFRHVRCPLPLIRQLTGHQLCMFAIGSWVGRQFANDMLTSWRRRRWMLGAPWTPCSSAGRRSGRRRQRALQRQRLSHNQAALGAATPALMGPRQRAAARAAGQRGSRQARQRTHAASPTFWCSAGSARHPL